ncbi:molybdenum cofactor biosynthesis protein B [Acuticoccus sp. M5D2P5]|uniref:molybdenum cofactor biosynthesis protein B n=1 Tax=Acuticoccus kalidii TaxID=2910977 RepID=UPI001F1B744A|nr:molybdenum cofactor biosynthesis protein B [Acuticoccus kalidii]MCF3935549.1 molybdenum cofactor biosynthesis protein B [Acuticoccus kalidii]
MPHIDETLPFEPVGFSVIIVSDTRDPETDKSGDTLEGRIKGTGHRLAARTIVPDDRAAIRAAVEAGVADPEVDVIITSGGTGFTGRDVTPDTIEPMFDKRMDGFSAVFHAVSRAVIGTSTIQSRCTAGLIGETFVFVLPGSPGACKDAWDNILVEQFDSRFKPCNFIEIMPRIAEK